MLFYLATLAHITQSEIFACVFSSIGLSCYVRLFLCLLQRRFKICTEFSLNAFKRRNFYSTCSYDARFGVLSVTQFRSSKNLQKKKTEYRISLAWNLYSICLSLEQIRIFNQENSQQCVTLFDALLKRSTLLIFEAAYTNR